MLFPLLAAEEVSDNLLCYGDRTLHTALSEPCVEDETGDRNIGREREPALP